MYEEAIQTVVTVRDFTQVFDSYAQFEESMIAAKMETTSEMGQDEDGKRVSDDVLQIIINTDVETDVVTSSM